MLTTVQPARQDLTNQISLTGKVSINPTFGIVSPAEGELRFTERQPTTVPVSRDTWVATVWEDSVPRRVYVPTGAVMAGRLMNDRTPVAKGMPVVSAKHIGYGIVAEIDSAQAYRISGSVESIKAQIKNGPGPFDCEPVGTIAALPAGTFPEPEAPASPAPNANASAAAPPAENKAPATAPDGSEPTGLRLVCVAPEKVKLINGAEVTLDVVTGRAENVLVLPVEAVAGLQGKGKVDLVVGEERQRKTIDVVLGISDGKVVEVKKGLTGNETVAVPGPNLPTAAPTEVTG
ncbi:efflux RND transporter periplasmic adaptor subunit [Actinoplanes sp. NEAU-A12]|uniref:Efflux RND transporter periplasmic adaptor subunit n=1 Tax=Actinoplanes sandaracinus TaxID=3045177 RepID=A0ABT6WXF9_9ACTN|nr:efflux RND transporter periplasmic adaptor subunit [Actinoplanes sandaracinus]MDI6104429.1 efflux RND transporter periplasmic adaptor subunit [Actinoplanes sandaracinus]